jgi:hypothetical protein
LKGACPLLCRVILATFDASATGVVNVIVNVPDPLVIEDPE